MIKSFRIVNILGESIYLDIRRPEDTGFLVTSVTGLTPPKANVASEPLASYDGSVVGNVLVDQRNIVFSILFYEDNVKKQTIEELRHKSYKYFPLKGWVRIFVENDSGMYFIDGIVESNDPNIFSQAEGAQISIVCPEPFFCKGEDEQKTYITNIVPLFQFPFSSEMSLPVTGAKLQENGFGGYDFYAAVEYELIPNNGRWIPAGIGKYDKFSNDAGGYTVQANNTAWIEVENEKGTTVRAIADGHKEFVADSYTAKAVYKAKSIQFGEIKEYPSTTIEYDGTEETGVTITITAYGPVTGFRINNVTRDEHIIFNDAKIAAITGHTIQKDDEIVIVTDRGVKSALLFRDGLWYNIITAMSTAANWIYLQAGPNVFTCSVTTVMEYVKVRVSYFTKVAGV